MDIRRARAQQTVKKASRSGLLGMAGLLTVLFFAFSSTAWAAVMVTDGGFPSPNTIWSLGSATNGVATVSTAQNHGTLAGTGAFLETVTGRAKASTGTATQSVTVAATSVITAKTDVVVWAMEQWTLAASTARTISIDLRYSDATTVNIFTGTVGANSAWTNVTNTTATVFPLTLTKNVNQITVSLSSTTGGTNGATSSLYADDIAITFTPAVVDSLTVTSNTPVATTGQPSQTNIQMQRLQLNSDAAGNGNSVITSATVDDVNVAAVGTIANLKVHVDANTNFADGVLGTATVANWNGQSTVVDLTAIAAASRTVTSGTPKYLWVTYDITAGALDGTTCISRITAIGVLTPDMAPLGGPWDSNSVLITAGLGCGGCHPLPVLDGAARSGATGAVVGNHATHGTTYTYACNTCHVEGSQVAGGTYTSRHRRGTIDMNVSGLGGVANARYDKNADHIADMTWSQTPAPVAWGKCENTACHGGVNSATSYGGPTGVGPTWGAAHASTCTFCHNRAKADSGVVADAYPTATSPFRSAAAVGAHAVHLTATSNLMTGGVLCADCHTVPGTVNAAGHILTNITAPADLTFGADAQLNSTATSYTAGSCTVYCHGVNTPGLDPGALDSTPAWSLNWTTYVPGTAGTCSNYCHGLPPTDGTHSGKTFPASCKSCHGSTVTTTTDPPAIVASFHINGTVEATGCTGCHGTDPKQYPPVSYWGTNKSTADGVGAHVAHLEATATYMTKEAIAPESNTTGYWCAECHTTTRGATGHDDAAYPANIAFTNAVESKYNTHTPTITFEGDNNPDAGNGATCSVYCHGVKMPKGDTSGTTKTPTWGVTLTGCGVCHGFPPTAGTSAGTHTGKTYLDCKTCHASTIADTANPPTLISAFHINGTVEATGCTGCHGTDPKQYPPVSFWGTNKSTADGVGAHVAHIEATSTYMTKEAITGETDATGYWCAECHTTTRGATGHDDAAYPANIVFTNAVESKYNTHTPTITFEADNNTNLGNGATCSVYCHGAKMPYGDTLGTARTPAWGVTLTGCNPCHGFPPSPTGTHAGVTLGTQCGSCHTATMTNGNATITNTANHINGTLEVTTSCTGCHNGSGTGAKKVGPTSSHTDPDGTGATYAAGGNHCAVCHFAGTDHSGEATGTIAVVWDNRTMGTTAYDGTTNGSYVIHLRKIAGTEATEAEICWGCHWDVTVPSLPTAIKEFGPTQGVYTTGSLNQRNWFGATWTSANFVYKTGPINSFHQAVSSMAVNPAIDTAHIAGDVATIGCSSCHDVHRLGNNGFTPAGQPYLRGSWTSNPFKEDGAPLKGVVYTSNRGSVPRGIDGTAANGYGGWQIEQNNATFANATYAGATGYAGLCANCHTQAGLEASAWAGFTTNGHKGAVSGFTGGTGGTDIFSDTRRGGTNSWARGYMSYNGVTAGRNGTSIGGLRNNRTDGWTEDGILPNDAPTSPPGAISYPAGAVTTITAGAVYQANFHNFPCSKCHSPHASRLPRLMVTNCLDIKHNTWDDQTPAPIAAGVPQSWAAADSHLADEISYSSTAQNCHRYVQSTDTKKENGSANEIGWNNLTPW